MKESSDLNRKVQRFFIWLQGSAITRIYIFRISVLSLLYFIIFVCLRERPSRIQKMFSLRGCLRKPEPMCKTLAKRLRELNSFISKKTAAQMVVFSKEPGIAL